MTTSIRTIRIEAAQAKSELASLDSTLEALTRDLGNLRARVDTAELQGLDQLISQIGEDIEVSLDVDTAPLDDVASALGESRTIDVEVDVDSAGVASQLDDLAEDRMTSVRAEAENVAAVDSELDGVADEERETVISAVLDSTGVTDALALLTSPQGAAVAAGAGIAGLLGQGFSQGLDQASFERDLSTVLGVSTEVAGQIGDEAGELYRSGLVGSIEEAGPIIEETFRRFGDAVPVEELAQLSEQAIAVSNALGLEPEGLLQTVDQIVESGLADTPQQALDLTTALGRGAVPAEALAEVLTEYAPILSETGITGEAAMGILTSSLVTTELEADKVLDGIKELGVRLLEITPETIDALATASGQSTEEIQALVDAANAGDPEGLQGILDALEGIEDPAERARLAGELVGSPYEDFGDEILQLDLLGGGLQGVEGSAQQLADNAQAGLIPTLTRLFRSVMQPLADFTQSTLVPALNGLASFIEGIDFGGIIDQVGDFFSSFAGGADAAGVFDRIREAVQELDFGAVVEQAQGIFDALSEAGDTIIPPLRDLIISIGDAVVATVELAVAFWGQFGDIITSTVIGSIQSLATILAGLFEVVSGVINTVVALLQGDWQGAWDGAGQIVSGFVGIVTGIVENFVNVLGGYFQAIQQLIGVDFGAAWTGAQSVVSAAIDGIVGFVTGGFDLIRTVVTTAMDAISTVLSVGWNAVSTVVTTVLAAIGAAVSAGWNAISTVITTAMNAISTVISTVWAAISTIITTALAAIQAAVTAAWTAISTAISTAMNAISTLINAGWTAIRTIITTALAAIQTAITTAWTAIRTVIQTAMTAIRTLIVTAWTAIRTAIQTALTAIRTIVTTAWTAIRTVIQTAMTAIRTLIVTAWTTIRTAIQTAMTAIRTVITTAWTAIRTTITTAMNAIRTAVTTAWTNIRTSVTTSITGIRTAAVTGFTTMRTAVEGVVRGLADGIAGVFRGLRGTIEGIVAGIRDAVNRIFGGINVPDFGGIIGAARSAADRAGSIIGAIPGLASGAIVKGSSQGTIVRLAENNADEIAMNAAQPFSRNLDLLRQFDDGALLNDLFQFWERQFMSTSDAMASALSSPDRSAGRTFIQHVHVEASGRGSTMERRRSALAIARAAKDGAERGLDR